MLPILDLGPISIQTPGLLVVIGAWVGLLYTERYARKLNLDANSISNMIMMALLVGLIGSRLSYAAQHPSAFSAHILGLLSLSPEMLDPLGGITAGLLAAIIYGQRKKLPFWQTLDALTPAAALFMAVLGLSHLASGKAYGTPTTVPWGFYLWGAVRHPSQIYEMIAATIIAVIIWPRSRQSWADLPGTRFLAWLALSAFTRIFLETFRGDSILIFSSARLAQLAAWIILAGSLWLLRKRLTTRPITASWEKQNEKDRLNE